MFGHLSLVLFSPNAGCRRQPSTLRCDLRERPQPHSDWFERTPSFHGVVNVPRPHPELHNPGRCELTSPDPNLQHAVMYGHRKTVSGDLELVFERPSESETFLTLPSSSPAAVIPTTPSVGPSFCLLLHWWCDCRDFTGTCPWKSPPSE